MKRAFDLKVASISTVVGVILVMLMVWLTGNDFSAPVFPFMAILAAYIIAGMVTALVSKGDTIAEPGGCIRDNRSPHLLLHHFHGFPRLFKTSRGCAAS